MYACVSLNICISWLKVDPQSIMTKDEFGFGCASKALLTFFCKINIKIYKKLVSNC